MGSPSAYGRTCVNCGKQMITFNRARIYCEKCFAALADGQKEIQWALERRCAS